MNKLYNRQTQLASLQDITSRIATTKGRLSVVVGRRRVGKTRLLNQAFAHLDDNYLYLFISRKAEAALVDEFRTIIGTRLGARFFQPSSLQDIFEYLFNYAKTHTLTLVVDEFQDIDLVNSSLFSSLQHLWDTHKDQTMMHLVCCGSLYSLMTKIFKGDKQPLLNRDDHFFNILPLTPSYIRQIMVGNRLYSPNRFLQWWCLSGGIPKYLEWLRDAGPNVFDTLISAASPLIKEGTHRLVEDFGPGHRAYFDVLEAMALGNTTRARIENYLQSGVGPVLEGLEANFHLIQKMRPITSKPTSRDIRYQIADPFLCFWFHFIHANRSAVEMENFGYIKNILARDFSTFSGKQLESLFTAILAESNQFNRLGRYWDTRGENEIDIVAINDMEKRIVVAEVKRQAKRYNPNQLLLKSAHVAEKLNLHNYHIEQRCFALDDIDLIMDEFAGG